MRPLYLLGNRGEGAAAAATLSVPLAAGLFGGTLASVCAFFGWVAHFPHASFFQLIGRIPASLVCGLPFYAVAGYLFARWVQQPPPFLADVRGFGRAPILLAYGAVCGGLRWIVTAGDSLLHFLHGEQVPIGIFNLFLLLPQVVFSALLATAAFAYPGMRIQRAVQPSVGRLPTSMLAGWCGAAWLAAFVVTYAFESGAGSLVPALSSNAN